MLLYEFYQQPSLSDSDASKAGSHQDFVQFHQIYFIQFVSFTYLLPCCVINKDYSLIVLVTKLLMKICFFQFFTGFLLWKEFWTILDQRGKKNFTSQ